MNPDIRPWAHALAAYFTDEDAASAAEYALTLAVIGGSVAMILHVLGARMESFFIHMAHVLGS
jgi:Flp pilus assembly pilin Flp